MHGATIKINIVSFIIVLYDVKIYMLILIKHNLITVDNSNLATVWTTEKS